MVRTQLYLDDAIHARLRRLAQQQGRTLSDLVREALTRVYGDVRTEVRLESLRRIAGLWQDRDDIEDSSEYVRRLRRNTRRIRRAPR